MSATPDQPQSVAKQAQLELLSQAAQLEEAARPQIIRTTLATASLAAGVFLVWAALTNVNEVAHTQGEIVPQGLPQTVQHLEGGLVADIAVSDGDIVRDGQPLIVLDDASLKEDRAAVAARLLAQRLNAERLRAFLENREPLFSAFSTASPAAVRDNLSFFQAARDARRGDELVIKDQIAQRRKQIDSLRHDEVATSRNLEIVKKLFETRSTLNERGLTSLVQLLEDEARLNDTEGKLARIRNDILIAQTEIAEFESRLSALGAKHRDQANAELSEVLSQIKENAAILTKIDERIERLVIRAPTDGLVKGLAINTVGAVIRPGDPLLDVVPIGRSLEAMVQVNPRDIGYISVGLPVRIKLTSFDFARYGALDGTVEHISATTFVSPEGQSFYRARIGLEQDSLGDSQLAILPGMTVLADIVTGDKTILQYLLKPIHISVETALRER